MPQELRIIGEAATNHNGNLSTAEKLVDAAVNAGADSVKFQIIYPEGLYLPKIFQNGAYVENEVFQIRRDAMLTDEEYSRLAEYCHAKEIGFGASVFDRRGIALLAALGADYVKLASCDLNNSNLLKAATEIGKKIIISTGMATLGEIEKAVSDIIATGHRDLVIMHCVSVYPCPTEQMNLSFVKTLQQAFGFPVGLSDHSESVVAGAVAVGMGVEWIEKHYTLDRSAKGFDHAHSLDPAGFSKYIADMRSAEIACRRSEIKVGAGESNVKIRARRSLYAARDIEVGEILAETDVLVVRPEGPMSPNDIDMVIGKVCQKAIRQFEPFTLKHIC